MDTRLLSCVTASECSHKTLLNIQTNESTDKYSHIILFVKFFSKFFHSIWGMGKTNEEYNLIVAERVKAIQLLSDLEVEGFAQITGLSKDIFYSIYSGRRRLTLETAKIIGESLDFDGSIIFDLNTPIPSSIKHSVNLKRFKREHIYNVEFFSKSWSEKKLSKIIESKLIEKGFFSSPKYTSDVMKELISLGEVANNDLLNKQLKYFTIKGQLRKYKAKLKNKFGEELNREVYVYSDK